MALFAALDHTLVEIPGNPPKLNFPGRISLMAWVRLGRTDGFHNIIAHGLSGSQTEVWLRVYNGLYHVGSWDAVNQDHKAWFPIPPGDIGNWVHLCGTHDGTNWTLYRNGKQVAQTADPQGAFAVSEPWGIGGRPSGPDQRFFDGLIAHVSVWNVPLDPGAIAVYSKWPAGITGTEQGLVAYWPMTEGSGTQITDRTATPAHGTLRSWKDIDALPGWQLETGDMGFVSAAGAPVLTLNPRIYQVRGDATVAPVISSLDGRTWTEELHTPPGWAVTSWRTSLVHNNCLYLLAGSGKTDVWASAPNDPKTWAAKPGAAPWAPRTDAAIASFNGKIWVLGGSPPGRASTNDVWTSPDGSGSSWQQQSPASVPWQPRLYPAACAFNGRLYVTGGATGSSQFADVWSTDGSTWRAEPQTAGAQYPGRSSHSMVVLGGKMFVIGGMGTTGAWLSDVYSSSDGRTWTPETTYSPWGGRQQPGSGVLNNRIYVAGGLSGGHNTKDVWSFLPVSG